MPSASSTWLQHTILTISLLLLLISILTLSLSGHSIWLLERYFPGGEWYIWRGLDATTYDEQQTPQQWVTVEYNQMTERLAFMRAVLGVIAGVLGVCAMHGGDVGVKVCRLPYPAPQRLRNDDKRKEKSY
jgi:hypothetical protein